MVKARNQTPFKPRKSPVKKIQKNKSANKPRSKQTEDDGKNFIRISKKSAVMYLGNIPHGFYEEQMRKYFSQFGKVLRTRVARSRRNGRSKGFGFIEFADADVAKIVAETVNNYIMNKRILKAKIVPPEEDHGKHFLGNQWSEKKYPALYARKLAVQKKNKRINEEKEEQLRKRKLDCLDKIKTKLQKLGYEWEPEMLGLPSNKNSPSKVVEVSEKSEDDENEEESEDNDEESIEEDEDESAEDDDDDEGSVDDDEDDEEIQMESDNDDSENSEDDQKESESEESEEESDLEEENIRFIKKSAKQYGNLLKRKSGGGITKLRKPKPGQILKNPKIMKMAVKNAAKVKGFNKKLK